MVLKYYLYLLALVGMLSCCSNEYKFDADALTYKGEFVYGGQFEMNGAYHHKYSDDNKVIMYLYQDGTYFSCGVENFDVDCEECNQLPSLERDDPACWGFFIVCNDTLKIQAIDPTSATGYYGVHKVEELWAIIEDSVTLSFFKRFRSDGGVEDIYDRTFNFYECSNKPDSTNILME